jgi:hypothetical protein
MPRYTTHGGETDASDNPTGEASMPASHCWASADKPNLKMKELEQKLKELTLAALCEGQKINPKIDSVCIHVGEGWGRNYFAFYAGKEHWSAIGLDAAINAVAAHNPVAEMRRKIVELEEEIKRVQAGE